MQYLKYRAKNFVFAILGLFIGFLIAQLVYDEPDFSNGIIAVAIGLVIGEVIAFLWWLGREN